MLERLMLVFAVALATSAFSWMNYSGLTSEWADYFKNAVCTGCKEETQEENIFVDPDTGYMWYIENRELPWEKTLIHCYELSAGGYTDWRLPTISVLKTLIKGCVSATACNVSDNCLNNECFNEDCSCNPPNVDNPDAVTNFLPPELKKHLPDTYYWSSSVHPNEINDGYYFAAWGIRFDTASIYDSNKVNSYHFICSRNTGKGVYE